VQKGQLGTGVERRILFIWEGAVAELPDSRAERAMESLARKTKRWDQAVGYWNINETALKWMWSFLMRSELRIDVVVTTRPAGFAQAVARMVERNNWPIRYVTNQSAGDLGRMLPTMPDVDRVYYGLMEQRWAFGPRGMLFPGLGHQIV
jgi:hypothetical protein